MNTLQIQDKSNIFLIRDNDILPCVSPYYLLVLYALIMSKVHR